MHEQKSATRRWFLVGAAAALVAPKARAETIGNKKFFEQKRDILGAWRIFFYGIIRDANSENSNTTAVVSNLDQIKSRAESINTAIQDALTAISVCQITGADADAPDPSLAITAFDAKNKIQAAEAAVEAFIKDSKDPSSKINKFLHALNGGVEARAKITTHYGGG